MKLLNFCILGIIYSFYSCGSDDIETSVYMHVIWTKTHRKELQTKLRETS